MVADVPNWFFSTWAFIGFVLCMIPLPWHIEGNSILLKYRTLCNAPLSLEHGHLPVHVLDGLGMLEPIHQFRGLEFGRHQQGASLVRHLYVFLRFYFFFFWVLLTTVAQPPNLWLEARWRSPQHPSA
jgi:hypothetical protein